MGVSNRIVYGGIGSASVDVVEHGIESSSHKAISLVITRLKPVKQSAGRDRISVSIETIVYYTVITNNGDNQQQDKSSISFPVKDVDAGIALCKSFIDSLDSVRSMRTSGVLS